MHRLTNHIPPNTRNNSGLDATSNDMALFELAEDAADSDDAGDDDELDEDVGDVDVPSEDEEPDRSLGAYVDGTLITMLSRSMSQEPQSTLRLQQHQSNRLTKVTLIHPRYIRDLQLMQPLIQIRREVLEGGLLLLAGHAEGAAASGDAVVDLGGGVVENDGVEAVVVLFVAEDVYRGSWSCGQQGRQKQGKGGGRRKGREGQVKRTGEGGRRGKVR